MKSALFGLGGALFGKTTQFTGSSFHKNSLNVNRGSWLDKKGWDNMKSIYYDNVGVATGSVGGGLIADSYK